MNDIDKTILGAIYIASLDNKDPIEQLVNRFQNREDIERKIAQLQKNHLLDGHTLTESGRDALKIVFAGGVFDIIHPGHVHTLQAAKKLGDILVVVVATDDTVLRTKKRLPLHNEIQRRDLVSTLSIVDVCLVGNKSNMFETVKTVDPQIIALGYDQAHQEKFIMEGCKKINQDIKVARLQSPVPKISSSKIQKDYGDTIYEI